LDRCFPKCSSCFSEVA